MNGAVEQPKLKVHIEYGDLKAELEGDANAVFAGFIDFLKKTYPTLETLSKIQLTVDLRRLMEEAEGIIGPVIMVEGGLTIEEVLSLMFAGALIGNQLKLFNKDTLTLEEIVRFSGKSRGALTGTLSRMKDKRLVEKAEGGGYKITPLGAKRLQEEVLPRLRRSEKEALEG
jgi:hypothetical protein